MPWTEAVRAKARLPAKDVQIRALVVSALDRK